MVMVDWEAQGGEEATEVGAGEGIRALAAQAGRGVRVALVGRA